MYGREKDKVKIKYDKKEYGAASTPENMSMTKRMKGLIKKMPKSPKK